MEFGAKVRTCLWFDGAGQDAAAFYVSLLPNSGIEKTYQPDPEKPPLIVEFRLAGAPYMVLNGGPHFQLNEAASISVLTDDQEETDRLWNALLGGGGRESRCGWLKDRFGLSWQIVPKTMVRLLNTPDPEASERVMAAMMAMRRIDIAALQAAHDNRI